MKYKLVFLNYSLCTQKAIIKDNSNGSISQFLFQLDSCAFVQDLIEQTYFKSLFSHYKKSTDINIL